MLKATLSALDSCNSKEADIPARHLTVVPTEPMGSMSSMEVNVDMLEQMDLMDISDQEALDVFLNSGGEENTLLSPISGRGEKHADIIIITLSTVISLWLGETPCAKLFHSPPESGVTDVDTRHTGGRSR